MENCSEIPPFASGIGLIMPVSIANCPLCKSDQFREFDTTFFRGQKITNQICAFCGMVFQSPRMIGREIDAFYAQEYRQVYQGSEGPTSRDLKIQTERASFLLSFASPLVPTINRHLDIGCSAGILLKTFKDYYHNQSIGIEPGDSYRDYSVSQGLKVYSNLDDLRSDNVERFDLISMAHVLEHIPDPVAYLVGLRDELLNPGGYLLVEVPNLYSHDSFEIAHMSSFSEHTLNQTLQQAGFSLVSVMKHGEPRSKLLPLYIAILAHVGSTQSLGKVNPEKWVKAKRRLGMVYRKIIQRLYPKMAWISVT